MTLTNLDIVPPKYNNDPYFLPSSSAVEVVHTQHGVIFYFAKRNAEGLQEVANIVG